VEGLPEADKPLIALVQEAWREGAAFARQVPPLAPSHSDYAAYRKLTPLDQATAVRRLIPRAVAQFRAQMEGASS
jgi:hypothetical protein